MHTNLGLPCLDSLTLFIIWKTPLCPCNFLSSRVYLMLILLPSFDYSLYCITSSIFLLSTYLYHYFWTEFSYGEYIFLTTLPLLLIGVFWHLHLRQLLICYDFSGVFFFSFCFISFLFICLFSFSGLLVPFVRIPFHQNCFWTYLFEQTLSSCSRFYVTHT